MRPRLIALFIIFMLSPVIVFSQEDTSAQDTDDLLNIDQELGEEDNGNQDKPLEKRVNLDLQAVYGQYNNMLSTVNFSQEEKGFVYYLSSRYKRSNDYGYQNTIYNNSSYFENSLDFTGNLSVDDSFTSIFQTGVENESRGMFDKPDYSREEKEKVLLSSNNIKKFSDQFEAYLAIRGAFYKHRLEERNDALEEVRNSLTRYTGETGGELIWSSSNRIRYKALFSQYSYARDDIPYDRYVQMELVDDFKISNFLGFSVGVNTAWNRDNGLFTWDAYNIPVPVMPVLGMTVFGNNYYTIYLNYRYDLQPFRPEEYYYEQHFMYPTYDLEPSKLHRVDGQLDLSLTDMLLIKNTISFEESASFYNYVPSDISENLITARSVRAKIVKYEINGDVTVIRRQLRFVGGYQFSRYFSNENITYAPEHQFNLITKVNSRFVNIDWTNEFLSTIYTNPDTDAKLDEALVGYLDVQLKTIESFYFYLRFENLYNTKYYLRDGYPEAGLTALMGLRILM